MILQIADVDADTWLDHQLAEQKLSPRQMVNAGYRLALPTVREYQQRIRAIVQAQEARDAAYT